jgi:hypothetical protein
MNNIYWFLGFVFVLALSRIIPHPPNFTPIIAVAVFAPRIIKHIPTAICAILLAMFIADIYWGLHSYMIWTYSSIIMCTLLATKIKLLPITFAGPVLFFVITNFAVWTSGYYGLTLAGLLTCYIAAIPFFHMTLLSTLLYVISFYVLEKLVLEKLNHRT